MSCILCMVITGAELFAKEFSPVRLAASTAGAMLTVTRTLGIDAVCATLCPKHAKMANEVTYGAAAIMGAKEKGS